MAITVPALDATTDIVDTDMLLVTHSDGTSEKISGSEINKRSKIIIASTTTVTGTPLKTGNVVRIYFTADLTAANASTALVINYNGVDKTVKVPKNGALADYVAFDLGSSTYKYLQAYTLLELIYDGTYFVIAGNPLVLSGTDYSIFADGLKRVDAVTNNSKDLVTSGSVYTELNNKAEKVSNATNNDIATLDASGNLKDSGTKIQDVKKAFSHNFTGSSSSGPLDKLICKIGTDGSLKGRATIEIDIAARIGNISVGTFKAIISCGYSITPKMYVLGRPADKYSYIRLTASATQDYVWYIEYYQEQGSSRQIDLSITYSVISNNCTVTRYEFTDQTDTVTSLLDTQSSGNGVALLSDLCNLPAAPGTDGSYTLLCTVTNGEPSYSWVNGNRSLPETESGGEDER